MVMERSSLGKVYKSGEIMISQGEKGNCMYVIQSGKAEVLRVNKDNQEVCLAILSKGDIFGEMALFQEDIRTATVRALGDVRVITVDKRIFLKRVHEDPSFAYTVLQKMSQRIRDLDDKMANTDARAE
jgi:CRP/FNR family cyclic AMP-dependent transcriptional regulator